MSLDSQPAIELTYAERVIWKKVLYQNEIQTLFDHQLERLDRTGNRITAHFRNLATDSTTTRTTDQVFVEHGTQPADELYRTLRDSATNHRVTDITALLAGDPQPQGDGDAQFALYRIGDAVSSRNIHAAVFDALRLYRTH